MTDRWASVFVVREVRANPAGAPQTAVLSSYATGQILAFARGSWLQRGFTALTHDDDAALTGPTKSSRGT